jgi:hypothetical protein
MLSLAGAKAGALGARATWVHAAVLEVPSELNGSADLVFTGNGALPWMSDIGAWARVVARLLRPGGRLVVVEGHPLNWVWDPEATVHRLSLDGRSYFDAAPRANETFPASAVTRFARDAEDAPAAWEYQWSLGQVVTATAEAGLVVVRLEEYPDHFWPQFGSIAAVDFARLPHTFSLVARAPAA